MVQVRPQVVSKFRRDAWLEINLAALERNLERIYKSVERPLIPVLKADAYGHGAAVIVKTLDAYPYVHSYGVASADEALNLCEHTTKPVMLLGVCPAWAYASLIEAAIEITVVDLDEAIKINQVAQELKCKARVHLKLDTGMHRIGFNVYANEATQAWSHSNKAVQEQSSSSQVSGSLEYLQHKWRDDLSQIVALKNLEIKSIYSHFADPLNKEFSQEQLVCFEKATAGLAYPRHIASSGIATGFEAARLDMVRCGIELYGHEGVGLEPLMSLYARISFIKKITAGESVSYKRAWIAKQDTYIATLPLGYADGVPRALSNRMQAYVHGETKSQAGMVTMDQLMIDLGAESNAKVGDIVELIGVHIPLSDWTQKLDTISYELLTGLNLRLPKVYTRN